MSARLLIGDVFARLAELEDGSVDLVVTSPPFLALRSYLPADHPDKSKEIGSEPTPAAFLDTLLRLTVEWRRVLAPHGSICIELGDTYAGGATGGENTSGRFVAHLDRGLLGTKSCAVGWPLDKSLSCIPTLYTASLAYGRNLLNPVHTLEPWRIRNVITWLRPNPPVGALGDKFRPATSFITVACTGRTRYFDLDAVRMPSVNPLGVGARPTNARVNGADENDSRSTLGPYTVEMQAAGAPPLDWHSDLDGGNGSLILATQPYAGAHYATFPSKLPQRLIEAMCPTRVCRQCGKPSERITEQTAEYAAIKGGRGFGLDERRGNDSHIPAALRSNGRGGPTAQHETLGWSDCGHGGNWRNGLVLDPFSGSGTTLAVASGMGRDAIGIDLDGRNADLARERCGMFLEVGGG